MGTAAQASVVAAPAPQIAYSAGLPPASAAPAPVAYSAPAASSAPRSTSFVPAPTISAAPVAYSAPVATVAPRSTSFVPVPAAGYTLLQTGYTQAAPVSTFPAASFAAPAPQVQYAQPAVLPAATSMVATPAYQQTAYGAPQYAANGTCPVNQAEYVAAPTTMKKKRGACC